MSPNYLIDFIVSDEVSECSAIRFIILTFSKTINVAVAFS